MRKYHFIFIIIFFTCLHSSAQYYFYNDKYYDKDILAEVGASVGLMNSLTDLNTNSTILKTFNICGSLYVGVMYREVIGLRLEATMGKADGADSLNTSKPLRLRNLSFTTSIGEVSLIAELHPLLLFNSNQAPDISPYILLGAGMFSFNPETEYQGHLISLQPLHTEGEGFSEYPSHSNYKLSQAMIPLGLGLKYELSPLFTIRGELVYRILFTDYLDDVSTTYIDPTLFSKYLSPQEAALAQALYSRRYEISPGYMPPIGSARGNPGHNDAYYSFNIKFGLILGRQKR